MSISFKSIAKEIALFAATLLVMFFIVGAFNRATPVFADTTEYDINVYAQVNGSAASSPTTLEGKTEGVYVELRQDLQITSNDNKTYLLKGWEDLTSGATDGLPRYTYRDVNISEGKAILGFYMPARDVNIKAVYEEATAYGNNTSNNLKRSNDDENLTGSLWQVSNIYMPVEGITLSTLTSDISSYIKDGVGDSIVYSANPFLSSGSTYNKTITFDAGSAGTETVTKRAGDLVVYAIPYAKSGHYIDDSSIAIAKESGSFTFIDNAAAYTGENTFFLTRYAIDSEQNRYVLLIFTMPDDNVTITASYPTAIPVAQAVTQVEEPSELSATINSKGELLVNFEDGRASVIIDTDDIQNNRTDILELQEQLGSSKRIYTYQVGSHIYFVTGSHTNISLCGTDDEKLAIIQAEKAGESFLTYNGSTITLVTGGNKTWQQVY